MGAKPNVISFLALLPSRSSCRRFLSRQTAKDKFGKRQEPGACSVPKQAATV